MALEAAGGGEVGMTVERMIELLEIEKECVLRNASGECNRYCAGCDLLQDDTELHEMYTEAIALLRAQEPRVMTFEEVKKKVGSGKYVFTECEKEGQWMRYGDARLSVDQGDSCRIAFLISRREDDPYVWWWMIYYKNYNKTWRCWTSRPDEKRRTETRWN